MPREVAARAARLVPDVLMIGTGEYTTGWVAPSPAAAAAATDATTNANANATANATANANASTSATGATSATAATSKDGGGGGGGGGASTSDKKKGVVFLCFADLRRRGLVGRLALAGTCGTKFPAIRRHIDAAIFAPYADMRCDYDTFPADDVERDVHAYRTALATMRAGDVCVVFTPDDTHAAIAREAIERGLHVLVTKPPVKTLAEHRALVAHADARRTLLSVEVHKRLDPMYADAVAEARTHGDFSYFYSFMSQPKAQLDTFRAWAGRASDISYYLNSHHVDVAVWLNRRRFRPAAVAASAASGIATSPPLNVAAPCEDVITLVVDWHSIVDAATLAAQPANAPLHVAGARATSVHTASWTEPRCDVHSQQSFAAVMRSGRVQVAQDQRGYRITSDRSDARAVESRNPLYMSYAPSASGHFDGQRGYGYRSFEQFVDAVTTLLNDGSATPAQFDDRLPTMASTVQMTAVLEAGRRSLDANGARITIEYTDADAPEQPTGFA